MTRWARTAIPAGVLLLLLCAAAANAVVVRVNGHDYGIAPRANATPASAQLARPQAPQALQAPHAARPQASQTQGLCTPGPETGCLTYGGGPVLHAITPYVIFWDPSGLIGTSSRALIERYLSDSAADSGAATNVWAVDRQFYDATGIADYAQTWEASDAIADADAFPPRDSSGFCDNSEIAPTYPDCLTDAQLQSEIANLISADHLPTGITGSAPLYVIVTPPNTNICAGSNDCASNAFCAYHSIFASPNSNEIVYAEVPMFFNGVPGSGSAQDPKACQFDGNSQVQEPNGDPADVALKYLSHEVSESITDPNAATGWINPAGGTEDGDQCNFWARSNSPDAQNSVSAFAPALGGSAAQGTLFDQIINGDHYYTQTEWSDGNLDCEAQPAPGTVTPAFAVPIPPAGQSAYVITVDPAPTTTTSPLASVKWNWGDGSSECFVGAPAAPVGGHAIQTSSGCSSSSSPLAAQTHAYTAQGHYTVTMTAVDVNGNVASTSSTVAAGDLTPTAAFGFLPAIPAAGTAVSFDATSSHDPVGRPVTTYAWSFGDGSAPGDGPTPSHVYARPGAYTVTLTVTDSAGVIGSLAKQVIVATGPGAALTSATAVDGRPASFTAAASLDAAAQISTYTWDFGDGSAPVTGEAVSHTYGLAGTFPVTLTITDVLGLTSKVTRLVTVYASPTAAFSVATAHPVSGAATAFDASASGDSSGPILGYAWRYGDGTRSIGVASSHVYARAGVYAVTLTVTDAHGIESQTTSRLVVKQAATITKIEASQTGRRAYVVTAKLSGAGRLTVAGHARAVRRAGTVTLSIPLSGAQRGTISIQAVFVPAAGGVTRRTITLHLH
jgi:PKD repeat protein